MKEILALIPKKSDGCITAKRLAEITKKTEPSIRTLINEYRTDGVAICSTCNGYYMAEHIEDVKQTIKFLSKRLETQKRAIEGLQRKVNMQGGDVNVY